MMLHRPCRLLLLLAITPSVHADKSLQIYNENHLFAHSETSTVKQIVMDDFRGPNLREGGYSFTHNRWELGLKHEHWRLGYVLRYDYALKYTHDTAELFYADKNDQPIQQDRRYEVFLAPIHARSWGLRLASSWPLAPTLSIEPSISYLQSKRLQQGQVSGFFVAENDRYSGQLDLDYVYDKDKLFDRVVTRPSGHGLAFDVALHWNMNESWQAHVAAIDLYHRINYSRTPFHAAKANSDRISFDDEGRIDVKPVLEGSQGYRSHVLRLPRQYRANLQHTLDEQWQISAAFYRYDRLNFPSLGLSYQDLAQSLPKFFGAYDFGAKAVTLGLQAASLRFSLTSDALEFDEAYTFGLNLDWMLAL